MENKTVGYLLSENTTISKPKIITELDSSSLNFTGLNESAEEEFGRVRPLLFEAELQRADEPNRNGRIYAKSALAKALNHFSVQEKLQMGSFLGELGHPNSTEMSRQMYLDLNNISHIVKSIRWDGNTLIGTVETADTHTGRDFRGMIAQGMKAAFSMRGVASKVTKDSQGRQLINDGLYIVSYDAVVVPSHQNSYQFGQVKEAQINQFNMAEALDLVKNQSSNLEAVAESYGLTDADITVENANLENGGSILSINKQNGDSIKAFLEDSIITNLDNYYLGL